MIEGNQSRFSVATATDTNISDTTAPTVTSVTSTKTDGTYGEGEVIPINVVFSEVVNVTGTPTLKLETGDTTGNLDAGVVNYTSGTGSNTLTFNYTVAEADTSTDLDYAATNSLANPVPNPGTPVYMDTNGLSESLTVVGNYAYIADQMSGMAIIDISDLNNLGNPVYKELTGRSYGITVAGNYAYLATDTTGLAIIDITDPTNPGNPVYMDTNGDAIGITVVGNYAYLGVGDSGLAVIDISDPTNPGTPIYRDGNENGNAGNLVVVDNYLYLADGGSGLAVIDISDPTNPGTPIYRNTNGYAYGVTIAGNYAYLGNSQSGLAIIDVSDPTNPGTPIYRDTSGDAWGVDVKGNYAYIADEKSGLAVIPLNTGLIQDAAGNDATLTLPEPGAANSLGANKAIVIGNTNTNNFTSTWLLSNGAFELPLKDYSNITINWGDNSTSTHTDGAFPTHTYSALNDNQTVTIIVTVNDAEKDIGEMYMNDDHPSRTLIRTITNWGEGKWESFNNAFNGATNLTIPATDEPDLSLTTSMELAFRQCTSLVGTNLNDWNVSTINNMRLMFNGASWHLHTFF